MTVTALLMEHLPPLVTRRHLLRLGVSESDVDRIWREVPVLDELELDPVVRVVVVEAESRNAVDVPARADPPQLAESGGHAAGSWEDSSNPSSQSRIGIPCFCSLCTRCAVFGRRVR